MAKILQITAVSAALMSDKQPRLIIVAYANAASPGWTDLDLRPLEDMLSDDGILDLEFVGKPPDEPVPQALTPVSAHAIIEKDASDVLGVLVHGRVNFLYGPVMRMPAMAGAGQAMGVGPMGTEPLPMPFPPPPFFPPQPNPFPGPIPTTPSFDDPVGTTQIAGEEGPTTMAFGEEGPPATTLRLGEEGGPTTMAVGEEGGTDPRFDDPTNPTADDPTGGRGGPFGGWG